MRSSLLLAAVAITVAWSSPASADPTVTEAAPTPTVKKRVQRRVEAHSEARSKVHEIGRVVVTGRRQHPMAVLDISRVEPKFRSGTAQYSDRAETRARARFMR